MSDYEKIADALKFINEQKTQQPTLDEVAEQVHTSPFHFQRIFTEWAGVSPKKFLQYVSLDHAKKVLKEQNGSVYDAAYQTGLSGTGRLHDLFVNIESMTPGQFKNGGKGLDIFFDFDECQFGNYLVASTSLGICNILFFDDSRESVQNELLQLWPNANLIFAPNEHHKSVKRFFRRTSSTSENFICLHLKGTKFQLKVWEALLKIPEGKLCSYSSIARTIEKPTAQRAVGTAIGSNPIAYIIPCHRVIKIVGGIGDYRWGKTRKTAMIGWEAAYTNKPQFQ